MRLADHIINDLPVFGLQDRLKDVIDFFQNTTFSHVAVVEQNSFLGLLAENDLEIFEGDKKIEDYRYNLEVFMVKKNSGWLDVLEAFARNEANLIPVLDKEDAVVGYYDLTDLVGLFIDIPFFKEPGGILVIAKAKKDYSFSEIAQIVESNNTKLLGAFMTDSRDDVVQVTLKIGPENMNEVVQTFRRYNYNILFGNMDDQFLENLKQRSNYLDKYLNV
ncbi:acetoin utilization protein acuB [Muriicola sp. Z0-33]|uniref:acetoin utilization protein acuB n=1 Tax=Muriicola sp. Z0-33 TaxID=2816957 RepID=UPI00223890D9|nr:acetoin utilization protein acuB [Muriicola sp. Z0-33]MCW5516136.1 acetoin utilization protein acuB [Muriicola sp. Z0-33]